jgi:hypothetical protein
MIIAPQAEMEDDEDDGEKQAPKEEIPEKMDAEALEQAVNKLI